MPIFQLNHVGLVHADMTILEDVTLSIDAGQRLTLVGPSGSGKSSILKLLAGLTSPSQGQVLYQSQDLAQMDMPIYRREVSYCFQQPVLFGQTVRDNLAFPFEIRQLDVDEESTVQALAKVDLPATFLDKKISELSGGEKQRVALVRNLLFEPQVLLLDEVTAGLDATSKALVHDLIADYHKAGHTIVEVTHDAEEIAAASTIIQVEKGRIVQ
ncbi:TPA: ATP-binding cassette domain-containing protein [Streptococcus suis]|uniref:ABC transporter ATP-binding protein n=1 Tax=Streptococcus sp. A34 TaxID=3373130 RepID=UPI003704F9D9